MIHEVKRSRAASEFGQPLFFCTSCEELFALKPQCAEHAAQQEGWPEDMECPMCGYLDGDDVDDDDDDDDEDGEAGDQPLSRGANDHQS